jgi:hypothetical protein
VKPNHLILSYRQLVRILLIMQGVWGTLVERDGAAGSPRILERLPARHVSGRGLGKARTRLIGDVKLKDPRSSNVEDIGRRGAFVGFGNIAPGTRADVFGLAQRRRSAASRALLPPGVVANFRPAPAPATSRTRSGTTIS